MCPCYKVESAEIRNSLQNEGRRQFFSLLSGLRWIGPKCSISVTVGGAVALEVTSKDRGQGERTVVIRKGKKEWWCLEAALYTLMESQLCALRFCSYPPWAMYPCKMAVNVVEKNNRCANFVAISLSFPARWPHVVSTCLFIYLLFKIFFFDSPQWYLTFNYINSAFPRHKHHLWGTMSLFLA